MKPHLVIYGAGGHGLVVAEAAEAAGLHVVGFVDDVEAESASLPWPILAMDDRKAERAGFLIAVGDNLARRRLTQNIAAAGHRMDTVIHPSASISPTASIGHGVYIGPGAIVNGQATIADGCIINSGAIVEHHCVIDEFAHIAPGAVLGGSVSVGELTLVGLGARILPGIRVGNRCTVGAGAVVLHNTEDNQRVVGVPGTVSS